MKLNDSYWNNRYASGETGWDTGEVTTPLKQYIDQLSDKSLQILIPGAGNAWEAEYLWNSGFRNTYVLDFASKPLEDLKKRVPGFPNDHLILEDFFDHEGQYQLIIEQTFFCAIEPELRAMYASKMHNLLVPGGKLAGVLFNDKLNNDKPPYGGSPDEYLRYFRPLFKINIFEECYNSIKPRQGRELFMILQKP